MSDQTGAEGVDEDEWTVTPLFPPPQWSVAPPLAVAALVMSWAALSGLSLLSGSHYLPVEISISGGGSGRRLVAGLLGAGLCLLPALGGWSAARRMRPDDPGWTAHVGRGAALVALVAVALRLAAAAAQYADGEKGFSYL